MNIRDIARIAGVSTSTVSKIVNGKDSSISEETRKKVLTIVKEYHYKPYASASQRTRSYTIGVLLRSPISFDSTLDGIIQAAQNAGYATDAYNSYSDPERELKNIAAICGRNVDGVIWEPATPDSLAYASQFPESTPLLTIGPNGGDQRAHRTGAPTHRLPNDQGTPHAGFSRRLSLLPVRSSAAL